MRRLLLLSFLLSCGGDNGPSAQRVACCECLSRATYTEVQPDGFPLERRCLQDFRRVEICESGAAFSLPDSGCVPQCSVECEGEF